MEYTEKRLDGETKYSGVIVDVTLDNVRLHDGTLTKREVVHHPGGVTILPVDVDGTVYCVRQYRYVFGRMTLEACAGKLEYGEDPRSAALRELSEETGLVCDELIELGEVYATPGYCSEVLHVYLALGLHQHEAHPDAGEFVDVEKYHIYDLLDMVMDGRIKDGKTIVAVLKAVRVLEERGDLV